MVVYAVRVHFECQVRLSTMAEASMAGVKQVSFSSYYYGLEESGKSRYRDKLAILGGIADPYLSMELDQENVDWQDWPEVEYPDIFNYLINTPSPYTMKELKAYKSLEGYRQFIDGWVSNINVSILSSDKFLVTARVKHSQRLSLPPAKTWVAAEKGGVVICAHCDCMAGLGEACCHIAAILFTLEANVQARKSMSCTSLPCSWLPPTFKSVPFAPISDIDFTDPEKRLKGSGSTPVSDTPLGNVSRGAQSTNLSPSVGELDNFFTKLSDSGKKPVILSLVAKHSDAYVPLYKQGTLPKPLTDYCGEHYLQLNYPDLLTQCEAFYASLSISPAQANEVEEKTREQSGSKVWFQQRSGRITASRFKSAACTDITQPSISLIRGICYPESNLFRSAATVWGCEHEKVALQLYKTKAGTQHSDFVVSVSGLVIDTAYPHLGSSPDGIVHCSCCGKGVIEIKCPYSCRDKTLLEATGDNRFCLEVVDGTHSLKQTHAYYYQVQAQMKLCKGLYCDFVVWTENDIVIQRILPDPDFIESAIDKCTNLFKYAILPELLGKYYTRLPSQMVDTTVVVDAQETPSSDIWCYCRKGEYGEMIKCESGHCKIDWFHTDCLKIARIPRGKRLCPECRKKAATDRKRKRTCETCS